MNIRVKCEKCNTLFAINVDNIAFNKNKQKLKCTKCNHIWYHVFNLHDLNKNFHANNTDTNSYKKQAIENDTISKNAVTAKSENLEENFYKIKIKDEKNLPVKNNNSQEKSNKNNFTLLTVVIMLFAMLTSHNNGYFNRLLCKNFSVKIEHANLIADKKIIVLEYSIINKSQRDIKIPSTRINFIDEKHNIVGTLFDINNDKTITGNKKIQLRKKITNISTDSIKKIEILTGNMLDFILY